jgi:hypothetical protein
MIAGAGRFAIYLSILVFLIGYMILAHLYIKPAGTRPYASTNLRLQIGVPKAGKEHRHVGNTYVHGTSSPGEKKMSSFPHLRLRTANSHGQATARHQRRVTLSI